MTDESGRLRTFLGWHRDVSFWREIYTRTIATLIAALVIFVVAIVGGYVELHGDVFIGIGSIVLASGIIMFSEGRLLWRKTRDRKTLIAYLIMAPIGLALIYWLMFATVID